MTETVLPDAVRRGLEEAEEFERKLAEETAANAEPVEEPKEPEPVPEPVKTDPPVPPTPPEDETWKARYSSLKGMFDAEVPRLQARLKELEAQLTAATKRLDDAAKAPKPTEAKPSRVTQKDVEAFGEDLIDVMKRQAAEVAEASTVELREQLRQLQETNSKLVIQAESTAEVQGELTQNAFLDGLAKLVPDWEQVNVDPAFLQWLADVDPVSGQPRQKHLEAAYQSRDVKRTAQLFTVWRPEAPPEPAPKSNLERQVSPGSARTNAPTQAQDKTWTARDIEVFYTRLAKGEFKGKEDEAMKLEAEIDRAIAENRIKA